MGVTLPDTVLKKYAGVYFLEADEKQSVTIVFEKGKLFSTDATGGRSELTPDSETTFFEDPASKAGYIFLWNNDTKKFELTIISTGIRLKAKQKI